MARLDGRRALVLASTKGIGYAIAQAFIQEGAAVCVSGRDEKHLDSVTKKLGCKGIAIDLDREGAGAELVSRFISLFDGIDILVTNTGGPPYGDFLSVTNAMWQTAYHRVFLSAILAFKEAIPSMRKQKKGRLIASLSTTIKEPILKLTTSAAMRCAVFAMVKTLALEEAKNGITANAILPGITATEHLKDVFDQQPDLAKGIAMQRMAEPHEIAALATFLASDEASYITGQAIACDGGLIKGL